MLHQKVEKTGDYNDGRSSPSLGSVYQAPTQGDGSQGATKVLWEDVN